MGEDYIIPQGFRFDGVDQYPSSSYFGSVEISDRCIVDGWSNT